MKEGNKLQGQYISISENTFVISEFVNDKEISISFNKENGRASVVVFDKQDKVLKDFKSGWYLHNLPEVLNQAYEFCGFSYEKFIKDIKEDQ